MSYPVKVILNHDLPRNSQSRAPLATAKPRGVVHPPVEVPKSIIQVVFDGEARCYRLGLIEKMRSTEKVVDLPQVIFHALRTAIGRTKSWRQQDDGLGLRLHRLGDHHRHDKECAALVKAALAAADFLADVVMM